MQIYICKKVQMTPSWYKGDSDLFQGQREKAQKLLIYVEGA